MPSIPQTFLSFKEFINFCKSHGLILTGGSCLRFHVELGLQTPPAIRGFHHTNHVVRI
jgi:hypothetical protein